MTQEMSTRVASLQRVFQNLSMPQALVCFGAFTCTGIVIIAAISNGYVLDIDLNDMRFRMLPQEYVYSMRPENTTCKSNVEGKRIKAIEDISKDIEETV